MLVVQGFKLWVSRYSQARKQEIRRPFPKKYNRLFELRVYYPVSANESNHPLLCFFQSGFGFSYLFLDHQSEGVGKFLYNNPNLLAANCLIPGVAYFFLFPG